MDTSTFVVLIFSVGIIGTIGIYAVQDNIAFLCTFSILMFILFWLKWDTIRGTWALERFVSEESVDVEEEADERYDRRTGRNTNATMAQVLALPRRIRNILGPQLDYLAKAASGKVAQEENKDEDLMQMVEIIYVENRDPRCMNDKGQFDQEKYNQLEKEYRAINTVLKVLSREKPAAYEWFMSL